VARAAGLPGRARQAGYALRNMPRAMHLPWHRVVGAGGRIVFPARSSSHREQA
ncbi:MAG: cysteine methyltransferase, partial [Gammaproteobacteria bacterium]|nr:cysteine methyltransferase [Gammaproteobacteria bacterium]